MSWIILTLINANLFVIVNLFDKYSVSKRFKNIYAFAVVLNIIYIFFNFIILVYSWQSVVFGWPFFWAAMSGLAYYLMWIFWWKALTSGEVSRASAIFFTQPLWNALFAFFILKESLTGIKWLAILFIVVGAILSSFERKKTKEKFNIAYLYVLISAIISALGNTISKYAMVEMPALTVNSVGFFISLPFFLIFLVNKQVRKEVISGLTHLKTAGLMFLRAGMGFGAGCAFMSAIGSGPVSLVSALGGIQPLLILIYSTAISRFFPKLIHDEISKEALLEKSIAVILIVTGAIIISLF